MASNNLGSVIYFANPQIANISGHASARFIISVRVSRPTTRHLATLSISQFPTLIHAARSCNPG